MKNIQVRPWIDGGDMPGTRGGETVVTSPATGEAVARQFCCDAQDAEKVVGSSVRAFASDGWQGVAPAQRGAVLLKLADLLERRAEELIELELLDTGKPISQLRNAEIPLCAAILRFYGGAADKIEGTIKPVGPGCIGLCNWEPYGVVAGILPWNYPLVNAVMKVAPAVAAGNALVLKPSVETPLSCGAFARLCSEAGLPPGIVNVVLGSGGSAGHALVTHPSVRKVSFTGSTAVGRSIQKLCADQMKAVNLECGGKNAIVVFADADLERAAQAVLVSAFVNCGQLCVSCSRLLVERMVADEFVAMLVEKAAKITVGDPRDTKTLVGPMITHDQYQAALRYLAAAPGEGSAVACGGKPLVLGGVLAGGYWIAPTILTGVRPGMKVHDEEIFGPVLTVSTFDGEAQAVEMANSVEYGLSGSIWTADGARALRMVKAIDTGILWVNTMLAGYPQIPVPPHKMSGTGVELGMEGLLAYCKRKSAVIGYDSSPVGWSL